MADRGEEDDSGFFFGVRLGGIEERLGLRVRVRVRLRGIVVRSISTREPRRDEKRKTRGMDGSGTHEQPDQIMMSQHVCPELKIIPLLRYVLHIRHHNPSITEQDVQPLFLLLKLIHCVFDGR